MNRTRTLVILLVGLLGYGAADRGTAPAPPMAEVKPTSLETAGKVRVDPYYWLAQRDDPAVRSYLEAENAYADAVMEPLAPLESELYAEIKGRIKKDDSTVPVRRGDHFYYARFEGEREYPLFARKRGSLDAREDLLIDANELARGHSYFSIAGVAESSNEKLLAFATDTVGRRIYTLRFKDLARGRMLRDEIPGVTGNHAWAEDGRTIFYSKQEPVTLRSYQVYRHVVGSDPSKDALVYEETDPEFDCSVTKTRSRRYLMIESSQTLSTEIRYLEATQPKGKFRVLLAREPDHEYRVDHLGDWFFIRTNWNAPNFRLMRAPIAPTGKEAWQEVVPVRSDVYLEDFAVFRDDLVLEERREGLIRLRVRPWHDGEPAATTAEHEIQFDEPTYSVGIGDNPEVDAKSLRFYYSSMTTPFSVYDYDLEARERALRKRDTILGGFDASHYATERLWATARDGARVPISLVYRKDQRPPRPRGQDDPSGGRDTDHARSSGGNPLLLYGYGSYGISSDAGFDPDRLTLLDRGFVFAIAHIRGGQELGRAWYEDGKLQHKMNTFTDFIDCAEHLVTSGWADRSRLFAMGGSAGGLLMGAVVNLRPDLFRGVVARVPFVDVVTTMLDDSIPLTTSEFDEWGDPERPEDYEYMLAYSPYDNVKAADYPDLLVTAGLHDSQVQYFEPAKWVAKLRATKIGDGRVLLVTHMEAGHGGQSGRFRRRNETAMIYAFLIDLARAG